MTTTDAVNLAIVALESADRNPLQEDALVALRHSLKDNWICGGGPAFPAQADDGYYRGMSLRDYFAAQVLQGYIACNAWHPDFVYPEGYKFGSGQRADQVVAEAAYKYADAMLKERLK